MYRKSNLLKVCGILCAMFTFVLGGLAYALSIDQPSGGTLTEGSIEVVELTLPSAFQYRLYYCCGICPATVPPWKIITLVGCDYFGVCPTKYYWEVPLVGSLITDCKLGVRVLDKNFHELGRATSEAFNIQPSLPSSPLNLDPPYAIVDPGGSAQFSISGGTPAYLVDTDYNAIMTTHFPRIVENPGTGYIKNIYTCGSDITINIMVTDQGGTGDTVTSQYIIDCP